MHVQSRLHSSGHRADHLDVAIFYCVWELRTNNDVVLHGSADHGCLLLTSHGFTIFSLTNRKCIQYLTRGCYLGQLLDPVQQVTRHTNVGYSLALC